MFCDKCGKEIIGDFCSFCVPETATNDTQKRKGVKKLPIILIITLLIGLVAFYFIGWSVTKPEAVIKKYIEASVNSNYAEVYDYLLIEDSEFLSKEIFLECTEGNNADEIKSIDISVEDEEELAYKVVYTTQTKSEPETKIIYLTKEGKKLLFFDDYKIYPNEYVVMNYSIRVPKYARVTLDGIEVDKKYFTSGSKGYVIPKMFNGTHTISINSDYTEDYQNKCAVDKFNKASSPSLVIKKTTCIEMLDKTKSTLQTLFKGMLSQKTFKQIEQDLNFPEWQMENITKDYERFCNTSWSGFLGNNFVYTKCEIRNIADESAEYSIVEISEESTGSFKDTAFECSLSYSVAYKVRSADGKYVIFLGDTEGEKTFNIKITYCIENGEFKIFAIDNERNF